MNIDILFTEIYSKYIIKSMYVHYFIFYISTEKKRPNKRPFKNSRNRARFLYSRYYTHITKCS